MEQLLKLFDFSQEEVLVYQALLFAGSAKVSDIAKKINIKRTSCQEYVKRLVNKGFINSTKVGNKYYYQPEDPDRFRQIINERQFIVDKLSPKLAPPAADIDWSVKAISLDAAKAEIKRLIKKEKARTNFGGPEVGGVIIGEKFIILVSKDRESPAIKINSKALVQFHKLILGK